MNNVVENVSNLKRAYICKTVQILIDMTEEIEIKKVLKKSIDTICHMAPEIIDEGWNKLNNCCEIWMPLTKNAYSCNMEFIKRYNEYKSIFENYDQSKIQENKLIKNPK